MCIRDRPDTAETVYTLGTRTLKNGSKGTDVKAMQEDVYKRQGYMSSEYLTYGRTEQQSTSTHVGFQNDVVEARQPVSYTHLDVYKRQDMGEG